MSLDEQTKDFDEQTGKLDEQIEGFDERIGFPGITNSDNNSNTLDQDIFQTKPSDTRKNKVSPRPSKTRKRKTPKHAAAAKEFYAAISHRENKMPEDLLEPAQKLSELVFSKLVKCMGKPKEDGSISIKITPSELAKHKII